jgi:hypothetical protein
MVRIRLKEKRRKKDYDQTPRGERSKKKKGRRVKLRCEQQE